MSTKCIETEIESIKKVKDPLERAKRVTSLFQELRDYTAELSDLRRDYYQEAHAVPGMTWQSLAQEVGMTVKALNKAASVPGPKSTGGEPWWRRVPEDVQMSAKLGPGGHVHYTPAPEMRAATLKALGDSGGPERPIDLHDKVKHILADDSAPLGSMRFALYYLMEQGWVERIGHGYYQITPSGKQKLAKSMKAAGIMPDEIHPRFSLV